MVYFFLDPFKLNIWDSNFQSKSDEDHVMFVLYNNIVSLSAVNICVCLGLCVCRCMYVYICCHAHTWTFFLLFYTQNTNALKMIVFGKY